VLFLDQLRVASLQDNDRKKKSMYYSSMKLRYYAVMLYNLSALLNTGKLNAMKIKM